MDNNNIEKNIKATLDNYESPLDKEALWSSILEVQGEKDSLPIPFWKKRTMITLLLFGITTVGLFVLQKSKNVPDQTISAQTSELKSQKLSNKNNLSDNSSNRYNTQEIITHELDGRHIEKILKNTSVDSKTTNTSLDNPSIFNSTVEQYHRTGIQRTQKHSTAHKKRHTQDTKLDAELLVTNSPADRLNHKKMYASRDLSSLPSLLSTELNPLFFSRTIDIEPVTCPSFKEGEKGALFIDAHLIPYYSKRTLKPNEPSDTSGAALWVNQRNNTEKQLESFQANILLKYKMQNGLFIRGGIGYGQIDEKLDIDMNEEIIIGTETGPTIVVIYGNGIPNDTILGEINTITKVLTSAKVYNYHRMIEIPIALGIERNITPKWGWYADGGIAFNLWTTRKGHILYDDKVTDINTVNNLFVSSTGLKLNGSFGATYNFNKNMRFSIGPDVRYHLQNWLHTDQKATQTYLDLGLRMGISYRIGG